MSKETEINLSKETQAAKSKILDAFIEAAKQGEVEFDFRDYYETFLMFGVTASFRGIEFYSYNEQSSGVRLEAFWKDEENQEHLIHFGVQDAIRLRSLVVSLAKKDPVARSSWRREQAFNRRDAAEQHKKAKKELGALKKIERSLIHST